MILLRTSTQVQGRPRMKSITCGHRWFRRCGVFSPSLSSWNTPRFPYSVPGLPEGALPRCWARKVIEQCLIDIEDDQSGHSTKLQFTASALEDVFNQANVPIQLAMARPISCGESSWT